MLNQAEKIQDLQAQLESSNACYQAYHDQTRTFQAQLQLAQQKIRGHPDPLQQELMLDGEDALQQLNAVQQQLDATIVLLMRWWRNAAKLHAFAVWDISSQSTLLRKRVELQHQLQIQDLQQQTEKLAAERRNISEVSGAMLARVAEESDEMLQQAAMKAFSRWCRDASERTLRACLQRWCQRKSRAIRILLGINMIRNTKNKNAGGRWLVRSAQRWIEELQLREMLREGHQVRRYFNWIKLMWRAEKRAIDAHTVGLASPQPIRALKPRIFKDSLYDVRNPWAGEDDDVPVSLSGSQGLASPNLAPKVPVRTGSSPSSPARSSWFGFI